MGLLTPRRFTSSSSTGGFVLALLLLIGCLTSSYAEITHNPSSLDSPLEDIQWCGTNAEDDQRAVLLTANGSVYRSSNRGANWVRMSDAFTRTGIQVRQDLSKNVGTVQSMIPSPVDPSEMVFIGSHGINWISYDCGTTIQALGLNMSLKEFQFHPTDRTLMLAASWKECPTTMTTDASVKKEQSCVVTKDLYLSKDRGLTWKILTKYVVQFAWGVQSKEQTVIPKERIVFSRELGNSGHQRITGWNMKTHMYYSDDFLHSSTMVVNQGNKFLLTESFLFVAQVHKSSSDIVKLLVSNANLKEYVFEPAQIPEELKQHAFTILDTSEGQVFININHFGGQSPFGTMYMSDSTGTRFRKSQENNLRSGDGQCDFEKVNGVEGIYISNTYKGTKVDRLKEQLTSKIPLADEEGIPIEKSTSKKTSSTAKTQSTSIPSTLKDTIELLSQSITTTITFDKGGSWQTLKPPVKDSAGKKILCDSTKKCSLHLHSISQSALFGPTYSSESSVGLILATGNTGQSLNAKADKVNTYLSRDGGLSWDEIRKGSHIFEVADHGSIIVLADNRNSTDEIAYSWDEGKTWTTKKISDTPMSITNIVTEPGNTGDKFLVYGTIEVDTDLTGVIVLIDFSQLHPRTCEGYDHPDMNDSDYETWVPHNTANGCLLGREMKYVRRKRDSACFNPEKFERPVSMRRCECTEQDWECDVGFERSSESNDNSSQCIKSSGFKVDEAAPDTCNGYYTVTQGYLKVAGDKCIDGVNHSAVKVPCPMFGFLSYNNLFQNALFAAALYLLFFQVVKHKEAIIIFFSTKDLDGYILAVSTLFTGLIASAKSIILPMITGSDQHDVQGYFQPSSSDEEANGFKHKPTPPQFEDNLIDEEYGEYQGENEQKQEEEEEGEEEKKKKQLKAKAKKQPVKPSTNDQKKLLDDDSDEEDESDPFDMK